MITKTRTQEQNEWIEAQNQIDQMEMLTEALNQTCDFTGWSLAESINNHTAALEKNTAELKRANDLKEKELI
ncbi:MAG: hypothetical protein N2B06_07600 [Clostridium sp.]